MPAVALNVHTAMLYARQATTSRVLQRGLLPMRAAPMPGLESAVIYGPGEEGATSAATSTTCSPVGDRWCFALGDVCGSGPEAAAVTGLARHAVRLLAKENYTVADILDRLNQRLLEEGGPRGTLPQPALRRADPAAAGRRAVHDRLRRSRAAAAAAGRGKVEVVATPQLLLGIEADARFFVETFELAPEEVLLCVTDGVTERRDGKRFLDDDDGLARLLSECAGLSADAVAERVRRRSTPSPPGRPRTMWRCWCSGPCRPG